MADQETQETPEQKAAREATEEQMKAFLAQIFGGDEGGFIMQFLKFLFTSFLGGKDAPDEDPQDLAKPATAAEIARIGKLIVDKKAIPKWEAYKKEHKDEAVSFTNPVAGGFRPITRDKGVHMHPIYHENRMHAGVDLKAQKQGTSPDILASEGGIVLFSGPKSGYGNCVIIGHADGSTTLYGHLTGQKMPEIGDEVTKGKTIGVMGKTGGADGIHLHYEQRKGDQLLTPQIAEVGVLKNGVALAASSQTHPYAALASRDQHPKLPTGSGSPSALAMAKPRSTHIGAAVS